LNPIRVLVVDDSAFARKVIREILSRSPLLEVVGIARDGLEALEKIAELRPDVVTLDLVMPNLNGVGVLQALPTEGRPRVLVVSTSDADSELGIEALQNGAIDLVQKPTALATDRMYELAEELTRKVIAVAAARSPVEAAPSVYPPSSPLGVTRAKYGTEVVVIGTSTGGPQALPRVLRALPADLPVPVLVVLHIPPGYTEGLARRLNEVSPLTVVEASEQLELRPGLAVIARGGLHLKLEREGAVVRARLDIVPVSTPHRPSVDVLFKSAATAYNAGVLGVVLTGMGDDGLEGSRAIRAAGGRVITESESSCIVYGMPRCVREAGLAVSEAPIDSIAAEILRFL
jgi:two-component system chemotaxis response regulator CheB